MLDNELRRISIWLAVSGAFLSSALTSQRLLDPLLLARLQIESVPLYIFDDVLLQDLSLKALQRALQALAFV
jgi:hypothetical protein